MARSASKRSTPRIAGWWIEPHLKPASALGRQALELQRLAEIPAHGLFDEHALARL